MFFTRKESEMKVTDVMIRLQGVDLSRPRQYIIERMGYSPTQADEVREEYKKFIALTVAYAPASLPTCKEVDDFWHAHILCTYEYIDMCKAVGAEYIHHNPCLSHEAGMIVGCYNRDTLGRYREHFGKPHSFWTSDQELCSGDHDYCGSSANMARNTQVMAHVAA
jgi:hypothetical protein